MYLINTIPFLRRHFSERLLDSISFIGRDPESISLVLMIVRLHYSEKMLINSVDIFSLLR